MTSSDKRKQTPPLQPTRDDLTRLRSASPAVKRPASDMGAQDREEHLKDVEMAETTPPSFIITSDTQSASDLKKQDTGKTHGDRDTNAPHASHPGSVQQNAPSEDAATSVSDSLLPTPSSHSVTSTSTTGIAPTCTDPPSFNEQLDKILDLSDPSNRQIGQKGFLVPLKWWNRIAMRSTSYMGNVDKEATEGDIGPLDNSSLAMVTEDSGKLLDIAGDKFVSLRPGLRYTDDYTIVPQDAWDLLISWHGLAKNSPVITRYAHDLSNGDDDVPNIEYETEPPIFTFLKVPSEHTTQTQKEMSELPPKMVASKYMPVNDWLKKAKELVHVDLKTKVRVWRILGGLKSHAPSGLPSPAASRSSSPAPGTEIVATVPDKMMLDVNTFTALPTGEHRDDLRIEDNTANEKYNGKSKLNLYAGKSDLIAIEEQKKSGDWPSETNRLSLPKNIKDKAKVVTPSGRSSPSPGMTTRGRTRREGRPKGIAGLTNLGNTCYMNSALQSIRSVQELTEYFLADSWKGELNKDNPIGHGGQVAKAYGTLIRNIFEEKGSAYTPRDFKNIVGRFNTSFSGYGQQDSQEFLLFLLDGLSEDLNRIIKKPFIEKGDSTDEMVHDQQALKEFADRNWAEYKARNDSVITDLFAGMYKSTCTCPVCDKVSIIFDPFVNLTLQLPIESTWALKCIFLPLYGSPKQIDVEVDKLASVAAVKEFVSKRVTVPIDRIIMAEGYKSKFYKIFDNNLVISEAGINVNSDVIFFMEVEDVPTNYNPNKKKVFSHFGTGNESDEVVDSTSPKANKILVPVFHRYIKNSQDTRRLSQRPFFGYGQYIVLNREDNKSYDAIMRKILTKVAGMTTRNILEEAEEDNSDAVMVTDDSSRSGTHSTEDEFVDVSMREESVVPDSEPGSPIERFARSKAPIAQALTHLFEIGVKYTGEGIPTGWKDISEHDDVTLIQTRIPKERRASPSSEESGGSAGDESAGDSDASTEPMEADPLKPSDDEENTAAMFNNFKAQNRSKRTKRVYGKHNKKFGAKRLPSPKIQKQPTPPRDEEFDMLVLPGEAIVCDWDLEAHDALFGGDSPAVDDDERGSPTWKGGFAEVQDEALQAKRQLRNKRKREGVTLEDCLNEFCKVETLTEQNPWYCPRCKEFRRAEKKFELWKVPDILIMHLKRFSSTRNLRDKVDLNVEYPVEGLDMTKYVQDDEGKVLIYDLIAVDNHYGGLGGGHYTAFAKNFENGEWYDFNDGHVSKRTSEQIVTASAYILFYRRRDEFPLGGSKLQGMLLEDGHVSDASSHDAAAGAGNGRRLGDSSHLQAGSSGLGGAAAAHRSGVGGDESQDPLVDNETQMMTDEGISMDGPQSSPPWPSQEQEVDGGWSFARLDTQQQHNTSVNDEAEDAYGSPDSTKAQGSDGESIGGSPTRDMDVPTYSDAAQDQNDMDDDLGQDSDIVMRTQRESAPPPAAPPPTYMVSVTGADVADDEDDDMDVAELLSDGQGGMRFENAPR